MGSPGQEHQEDDKKKWELAKKEWEAYCKKYTAEQQAEHIAEKEQYDKDIKQFNLDMKRWRAGKVLDKPALPEEPEVLPVEPVDDEYKPSWLTSMFDSAAKYFDIIFAPDDVTDLCLEVMSAHIEDLRRPSLDVLLNAHAEEEGEQEEGEKDKKAWRRFYTLLWESPPRKGEGRLFAVACTIGGILTCPNTPPIFSFDRYSSFVCK